MSKFSKLLQVTEEEKVAILKKFNIDQKEFDENVQRLKEWLSQCEHLPHHDNYDHKLQVCLLNGKMSIEKAKQILEGYYKVRTQYSNEFFDKLMPNTEYYMLAKKFVKTAIMPKLTPNLSRITIFKLSDPEGEANDAFLYELMVLMMAELRIQNDFFVSNTIIIDFEEYGWKNLLKFTPTFNQKMVHLMNAIKLRIDQIHFINIPNFIDHIMMIMKGVLPAKIVDKIHSHKTYKTLWEHIPREYLPCDYEGTEKSVKELYEEWCEQIEESEEVFTQLLNAKAKEKTDLDPFQKDLFGIGSDGSFKKLIVD